MAVVGLRRGPGVGRYWRAMMVVILTLSGGVRHGGGIGLG